MAVTVVLVDDQSIVRAGLTTIFAPHDDIAVVGEASDGREAIDVVAPRLRPGRRPHGRANASARRRRRDWPRLVRGRARTRVCMLTTYGLDDVIYNALAAGASGFLLKTDPPERIVSAVRLAAGEPVLSPSTVEQVVAHFVAAPRPSQTDPLDVLTERERCRLRPRGPRIVEP